MHVDWNGCIPLDYPGTVQDLNSWKIELVEGMQLLLYQEDTGSAGEIDDLVAVGTVTYDDEECRWVVRDWEPTPHASELELSERALYQNARANTLPS